MNKQQQKRAQIFAPHLLPLKWMILLVLVASTLMGCSSGETVEIEVLVNSGASDWASSVVDGFNREYVRTSDDALVLARLVVEDAGNATVGIVDGSLAPHLWIPDDKVWANVAADRGNDSFQGNCQSTAQSPLVIGMWRDVATSLGWPGRELGWLDVGSLAADQSAWAYYSGGQFGETLRLGHTHPGLSGSGTSTLLALVQAAESKQTAVTPDDIADPIVQASVGAFESAVSWFSDSTGSLGSTMAERGVEFLGAAVMYENTVLSYATGDIVPIYPFEGTFVATHPACVNDSLSEREQDAAERFREWMLGEESQEAAVEYGLRRADGNTAAVYPLSPENNIRLDQPSIVFPSPSVESVYAVQELWQSSRKPIHLAMLIDTSGSMEGSKMSGAREAAAQFVEQMGDEDRLTLIQFETVPRTLLENELIGGQRDQMVDTIRNLEAVGGTTLYDAIGLGGETLANNNSASYTNALIALTDGEDTDSVRYGYDQRLVDTASANNTTVVTIAYGNDALTTVLETIAREANGQFYAGGTADIGAIYQEMSAAFGGSAGIGR